MVVHRTVQRSTRESLFGSVGWSSSSPGVDVRPIATACELLDPSFSFPQGLGAQAFRHTHTQQFWQWPPAMVAMAWELSFRHSLTSSLPKGLLVAFLPPFFPKAPSHTFASISRFFPIRPASGTPLGQGSSLVCFGWLSFVVLEALWSVRSAPQNNI